MTKKAIDSMPEKARQYCEDIQQAIRTKYSGDKLRACDYLSCNLKGYLECLADLGQIKRSDVIILYSFYATT